MAANDDKTIPNASDPAPQQETLLDDDFSLELQVTLASTALPKKTPPEKRAAEQKKSNHLSSEVLSYRHDDKRTNNPHVGMVDTHSDGGEGKTVWQYDPHIDPALNFDCHRSMVGNLIDDALASGIKTLIFKG